MSIVRSLHVKILQTVAKTQKRKKQMQGLTVSRIRNDNGGSSSCCGWRLKMNGWQMDGKGTEVRFGAKVCGWHYWAVTTCTDSTTDSTKDHHRRHYQAPRITTE